MKITKYINFSIVLSFLLTIGACTDLDETVYDKLTDETIDVTDPGIVGSMMGEVYAQVSFLVLGMEWIL